MRTLSTKVWIIIMAVVLALMIGGGAFYFYRVQIDQKQQVLNVETIYDGITVAGVDVGGKTIEEAQTLLETKQQELADAFSVTFYYEDQTFAYAAADLALSYNTAEVLQQAYAVAREGSMSDRYELYQALQKTPQDFELAVTMQEQDQIDLITAVAEKIDVPKQEGLVTEFKPFEENPFTVQEGVNGLVVDQQAALSVLSTAIGAGTQEINVELVVTEDPCTMTTEEATKQIQLLATATTSSKNTESADENMKKALEAFNGMIVESNDIFSFNTTVGDTSIEADGWLSAPSVSDGKSTTEIGGGVSQVASTLYAATLRAGMTMIERQAYPWTVDYIDAGEDVLVEYGSNDFQFQNTSGGQVFIEAAMDKDCVITINIYGTPSAEWDSVEIVHTVAKTYYPEEIEYRDDSTMTSGKWYTSVEERTGYDVESERVYYLGETEVSRESIDESNYKAVQGVIVIGTKTSSSSSGSTGGSSSGSTGGSSSGSTGGSSSGSTGGSSSGSTTTPKPETTTPPSTGGPQTEPDNDLPDPLVPEEGAAG